MAGFSSGSERCRDTKSFPLVQKVDRHASPLMTIVYTHPSNEELYQGIRDLTC
jgi:hypothetical protein